MLLKQLIQQPTTSSNLLVCDPFRMTGKEELVKEVIGLANAKVDGPRHILFGINPGAMEGSKIVGIDDGAVSDLKKAHRHISELIEPVVSLAFIYDSFDGKLVGALEIDDCDDGPFAVGQDYSKELSRGKSWIREGRELREADIADLAKVASPEATAVIDEAELVDPLPVPTIDVGFNDDPDSKFLELSIPDTSDPPFANERQDAEESRDLRETIRKTVNTVTTQILKLARKSSRETDPDSSTDVVKAAQDLFNDVDKHYYYEEKALQLNLAVCNKGEQSVRDIRIELGFPVVKDFDIADRIYVSPFDKSSPAGIKNAGYPEVEHYDQSIIVKNTIGELEPNSAVPALKCDLRMAVGPAMQNKKLAILYTLRRQEENIGQGRLKIRFGKVTG
jgi:schlafen family protein